MNIPLKEKQNVSFAEETILTVMTYAIYKLSNTKMVINKKKVFMKLDWKICILNWNIQEKLDLK